jgi:hypothetical protein
MKYIIPIIILFSCTSLFAQGLDSRYPNKSIFKHQIYAGSSFPLRVHVGYELKYKRLQIGGFVGFTPNGYQKVIFDILEKIKNSYKIELDYLRSTAKSEIQFGGEIKYEVGKKISIGLATQTFNANLKDTPKRITAGILPEEVTNIEALANYSAEAKNAYQNKQIEAYMNSVLVGPTIEKMFWLDSKERFFIKAKFSYLFIVKRENDLKSQDFTAIERLGVDSIRPKFLDKLEKVSSQLQVPSLGLELGLSF